MNYFHVLWTRPQLKSGIPAEAQQLILWDFELLTWLLSTLVARRHGPLRLITDRRGVLAAQRSGMGRLYTDGVDDALEAVPQTVDPALFWAAGKLYAYRFVPVPCVCLDMDAVLWNPVSASVPVMALHPESKEWIWYRADREQFSAFGFEGPEWDWELDPFNTGAVCFTDAALMHQYADTATGFVERYSETVQADAKRREASSNAMVFAEQRLLPMCAQRLGVAVQPLISARPGFTGLPHNPECLHLWSAKLGYKMCADARLALVRWLIDQLQKSFPEAEPLLRRWQLDTPKPSFPQGTPVPAELAHGQLNGLRFSLLRNVRGRIRVEDVTTGVWREASEGSLVWSGEILRPEPGARFDLEVIGLQTLQLQATG